MASSRLIRIPQDEFNRLAVHTMLGPDARQAAEDVLVRGMTLAQAARLWTERVRAEEPGRNPVSYQQVQTAVSSLCRHRDEQTDQRSVVALTVELPGVLASALEDLAPRLVGVEGPRQGEVTAFLEASLETASQMLDLPSKQAKD